MTSREQSTSNRGPIIWPLIVAVIGVLLLLNNFLLLGELNIRELWPLALVVLGAQVLLKGDLIPGDHFRTFGITRGSVESGTLEINAGEIDVNVSALQNPHSGRLIAGQYAGNARPELRVEEVHAHLRLARSRTSWLSYADWEMGLSQDLPWQIVASSYLGQMTADMSHLIMQNALISTGMGDIRVITPYESFETIYLRSVLGNVHVSTPAGYRTRISVEGGPFFSISVDETRYEEIGDRVYVSLDVDEDAPVNDVVVRVTFGDVYLS